MFGSKNKKVKGRTEAGSPIVTSRVKLSLSGDTDPASYKTAVVKSKDGQVYRIPIDDSGRVPENVLIGRFMDVSQGDRDGKKRRPGLDRMQTASKTYRIPAGGFTPEEIVETGWWQHPNECDIEGIDDTPKGPMGDFGDQAAKFERATRGRIAIIAPTEEEKRRVAGVLAANFTESELKAAAWEHGLTIMHRNPGSKLSGYYTRRQEGVDSPIIVLRPYSDDETIIHEFCHHLRAVDPSRKGLVMTPFPQMDDGTLVPDLGQYSWTELSNLEEAENVAETTGRTVGIERTRSGYYQQIPGYPDYQQNFRYDRELLTGGVGKDSRPKKGRRLMDAVNEDFDDTRISGLKYGSTTTARGMADSLRADGSLAPRKAKKGARR